MGKKYSVGRMLADQRDHLEEIEDNLTAKGRGEARAKRLEDQARANLKRDAAADEDQRLADEIKRLADEDQE